MGGQGLPCTSSLTKLSGSRRAHNENQKKAKTGLPFTELGIEITVWNSIAAGWRVRPSSPYEPKNHKLPRAPVHPPGSALPLQSFFALEGLSTADVATAGTNTPDSHLFALCQLTAIFLPIPIPRWHRGRLGAHASPGIHCRQNSAITVPTWPSCLSGSPK